MSSLHGGNTGREGPANCNNFSSYQCQSFQILMLNASGRKILNHVILNNPIRDASADNQTDGVEHYHKRGALKHNHHPQQYNFEVSNQTDGVEQYHESQELKHNHCQHLNQKIFLLLLAGLKGEFL